ncbi:hypothetical protein XELAEV_18015686mg [Xenopus laevis]|uniref:Uncharacterized protein n=1 Tax=Xenopus laevis TaxID=8355 RepID=A0A974HW81_XENLA|nr:hypothetical protein XELAEV_18015686mg [Xenopus laevis]
MFQEDEEFVERWESILNKCSFDLELALMERIQKELPTVAPKKTTLEQKVRNLDTVEKFEAGRIKLQTSLHHFQEDIEMRKRRKFQRDGADYENGYVYRWPQREQRRYRRDFHEQVPMDRREGRRGDLSTRVSDTDSLTTSLDFLGGAHGTLPPEGEGGAAANIREEGRRMNRPQRTQRRPTRWW